MSVPINRWVTKRLGWYIANKNFSAKPVDMWITYKKRKLPTYPQAIINIYFYLKTMEDYFLILSISGLDMGSTSTPVDRGVR